MSLNLQVHEPFRCELGPERERVRVQRLFELTNTTELLSFTDR